MGFIENFKEKSARFSPTPARKRMNLLLDEGSFQELDRFSLSVEGETGVITGYGTVEGNAVYVFIQDNTVCAGAVGQAEVAKIQKIYHLAAQTGAPLVGIYDSNGAKLNEGMQMLAAYQQFLSWSSSISGVVPQIAVIAGPCGGTMGLVACAADLVIMAETGELFLTPPEVAAGTQKIVTGDAKTAAKTGLSHITAKDDVEALAYARRLLAQLPANNLSPAPLNEYGANSDTAALLENLCEASPEGLDADAFLQAVCDTDSITELQPDFGGGMKAVLAGLGGNTVGFLVMHGTEISGEDCIKAARFVRMCDAFALPVVTVVDTPGFAPQAQAQLSGILREAAKLTSAYAEATTQKITLITGKAYGAAYVTFSMADFTFAWPSASITALNPDAAITILWKDRLTAGEDREALKQEYHETQSSAFKAAQDAYVTDVIHPAETRQKLLSALDILAGKRVTNLPKKHVNLPL